MLNTNGAFLARRLDQGFNLRHFDVVGLSIDGSTPGMHRAMRGPKASLDDVLDAARRVAGEPGIRLKIGTVLSGVNRDDVAGLARLVRTLARMCGGCTNTASGADKTSGSGGTCCPRRTSTGSPTPPRTGRSGAGGRVR